MSGVGREGEGGEIKYYIHAPKTIKKNKILHSDQFSLGPGFAVGGKLEREKTKKKKTASQASQEETSSLGCSRFPIGNLR